jgi:hypothetical protein
MIIYHVKYPVSQIRQEAAITMFPSACFSEFVKPICLPFDDTAPGRYLDEELVVTGWGRTEASE